MKEKKKTIIFQIIIIFILTVALGVSVYFVFFQDKELRDMGYTRKEIALLKQYELEDDVTDYNQSLLMALQSQEFKKENLDYYTIISANDDITVDMNRLAERYSVEEVTSLYSFLKREELFQLVFFEEKVQNINVLKQAIEKGYTLEEAYFISNSIPAASQSSLLGLDKLDPHIYLSYLNNGYGDDFIKQAYLTLEATVFEDLSKINYFPSMSQIIANKAFETGKLARYLWRIEKNNGKVDTAITDVNKNKDVTAANKVDYTKMYDGSAPIEDDKTDSLLVLVNKQHSLTGYIPELTDLPVEYRGNNQGLRKEAADAFIQMADAFNKETSMNLIAQSNYLSMADQTDLYNRMLEETDNDIEMVNMTTPMGGYSEHQTGLAIDIIQKGSSLEDFGKTSAASWLKENAAKYGFIKRYNSGSEWITGYSAISYHYRYVGTEAAEIITRLNITLEEYCYLFVK